MDEKIVEKLIENIETKSNDYWKQSENLLDEKEMNAALVKDQYKNQTALQSTLKQRKRKFLSQLQSIRRKYKGKDLDDAILMEHESIRVFFRQLWKEEKMKIQAKLYENSRKWNADISTKIEALQDHFDNPKVMRKTGQFSFFLGVVLMNTIQAILLKRPQWMTTFYMWTIIPLMLVRYFQYHMAKYHYFMLDFCCTSYMLVAMCYEMLDFLQIMLILYITLYPSNASLFRALFVLANGPLMWAIVMWKNSIVFHSLDKVTSTYIHVLPSLVSFTVRWYPDARQIVAVSADTPIVQFYAYPLVCYAIWQAGYLIKTEWLDKDKLANDMDIDTSFRHLQKMYKNSFLYKVGDAFGERYRLPMFLLIQLAFTLLTILPTCIFYHYKYIHAIFICFICLTSIWNGASYYVYKFARHQELALHRERKKDSNETWYETWIRRGASSQ